MREHLNSAPLHALNIGGEDAHGHIAHVAMEGKAISFLMSCCIMATSEV